MKRRSHYQERRAHADGWKVWELFGNKEFIASRFTPDGVYEIEPDKDGWVPFYATEDSVCPVDGGQMVEVDHFEDKEVRRFKGKAGDTRWEKTSQFNITRYRLVKEVDPYAELKAAEKAGETIQAIVGCVWRDCFGDLVWSQPPEQYRVKPKTKTIKLSAYITRGELRWFTDARYSLSAAAEDNEITRVPSEDKEIEVTE
jgi:hypothetical protein